MNLKERLDDYFKDPENSIYRKAVRATMESLEHLDTLRMDELLKELGKGVAEAAYSNNVSEYEIVDTHWQLFDFGNALGIAGGVKAKSIKRTLARFLYRMVREIESLKCIANNNNVNMSNLQDDLLMIASGEKTLTLCPSCNGKKFVEEDGDNVFCHICAGKGYRIDGI